MSGRRGGGSGGGGGGGSGVVGGGGGGSGRPSPATPTSLSADAVAAVTDAVRRQRSAPVPGSAAARASPRALHSPEPDDDWNSPPLPVVLAAPLPPPPPPPAPLPLLAIADDATSSSTAATGWAGALSASQRRSARRLLNSAQGLGVVAGVALPPALSRALGRVDGGASMASLASLAGGGGGGGGRPPLVPPMSLDQLLERLCEHLERVRDRLDHAIVTGVGPAVGGGAAAPQGRAGGAPGPLLAKWASSSSPALPRAATSGGAPVSSLRGAPGSASLASGLLLPSSAKRVMAAAASKKADLSMLVSLAEEEEEDGVHDVGAQSPTPPQDAAAAGSGDRDGDGNVAPARDELSGGLASQQALSRSARSLLDGLGRAGSGANGYGEDDPDARAVVTLLSDLDVDGDAQSAAPGSLHRPPSSHVAPTLATAGGQMRPVLSVDGRESLLVRRASSRRRLPPGPELAELAIRSPGSSYLSQRRSSLGLGGEESPHDNPQRLRRDYSKIFKPGGAVEPPADGGGGTASRHDLYRPGSVGEGGARPAGPPGSLRGGIFGGESMASLATVDYGDNLLGVPDSPVANGERSMLATAGGELYLPGPPQSRWVYGRKLGEGGNSTVRLATSTIEPGVRTAVKVIDKRPDDQAHEKMVAREVFSYRLLSLAGGHEHIVELIEVGEDDTHVYMFMELLQGGELFSRISDKGQYTEKDAARLTAAMLSALAFCHRLNITHRDVKAENFVYVSAAEPGPGSSPGGTGAADNGGGSGSGARYDIKLIDFGISHYSEDPNELCNTLCGTPLYVAPEVLLRQPYGFESDMWSVVRAVASTRAHSVVLLSCIPKRSRRGQSCCACLPNVRHSGVAGLLLFVLAVRGTASVWFLLLGFR